MLLSSLGSGGIKSIQRGTAVVNASTTLNITVSAVDMGKSMLLIDKHQIIGGGSTPYTGGTVAALTSTTNIQVANSSAAGDVLFSWQLVEYR